MFFCYVLVVYRSPADVQACLSLLHTLKCPLAIEDVAFGDIGHKGRPKMRLFFKTHARKIAAGAVIAVASLAVKKLRDRTTDDSQTAGA